MVTSKTKAAPAPKASKTEAEAIDRLRIAIESLTSTMEFVGLHVANQISDLDSTIQTKID